MQRTFRNTCGASFEHFLDDLFEIECEIDDEALLNLWREYMRTLLYHGGAQTSPTYVTSKTEMVPQSRKVKEPAGKVKPRYQLNT